MKTHILRKVRKQCSYRFYNDKIIVCWHKNKRVIHYISTRDFVNGYVLSHFGIATSVTRERKLHIQDDRKEYYKEINRLK